MKYSVYDYTRRVYDYYDASGPGGTHAGSPPVVRPMGGVGVGPDSASWRLPMGARKVGSGEMPQGRIASLSGADLADVPHLLTYAVAAYLAWRLFR